MKTEFKLIGLAGAPTKDKDIVATCEVEPRYQNTFTALLRGTLDQKTALWNYCSDNWDDPKIAVIKHDGLYDDGTPKNPIIVEIKHGVPD